MATGGKTLQGHCKINPEAAIRTLNLTQSQSLKAAMPLSAPKKIYLKREDQT